MPRPIVVEGPDGAGKSTLIKALGETLGLRPFHTGGPQPDTFLDNIRTINQQVRENGRACLFDRIPHISEPIYAKLRGGLPDGIEEWMLDSFLSDINPIVIYCRLADEKLMRDNISTTAKAHKSQSWLSKVMTHHDLIVRDYDQAISRIRVSGVLVLRYDYTKPGAFQVELLQALIQGR